MAFVVEGAAREKGFDLEHLTEGQVKYIQYPGEMGAAGYDGSEEDIGDIAITDCDDKGWIFVEQQENVGQEGSGVWVDPDGFEHQGP